MSLRTVMQRTANMAGRRFASTTASLPKPPVPKMYTEYSFKESFLSDPSTYPLIVVMTVATGMVFGALANGTMYKNVRFFPSHKHTTMNTWDTNETTSVTEIITRQPVAFHRQAFKDLRREGLGVDHEEWKKGKDAYSH